MSTIIQRSKLLSTFACLGDKCEDTCCRGWSMQLDEATLERYKQEAPELLGAVEPSSESPWIMRKDPASGKCIKFEGGLCGIHKQYGDRFLGDACHFYPRVTRALGDTIVMTATLSCPEIARLALQEENPCSLETASLDRVPQQMKNYLPAGLSAAEALAIHQTFLDACNKEGALAEDIFLHIAAASRSLDLVAQKDWPRAVPFYLKNTAALLPPQIDPTDPFNLLHALAGLIIASHKPPSERLTQTLADMEKALAVTLDWQNVTIHTTGDSLPAWLRMKALWEQAGEARFAPVLRSWLQMQLSLALYPFAGLGSNLGERTTLIGVRLATVKLALMSAGIVHGPDFSADHVIRILQSLSRFLDHLGDAAFSLSIYKETGWVQEGRLHGLLKN